MTSIPRRSLLALLIGAPVAACQTRAAAPPLALTPSQQADADYARWYVGRVPDGEYEIPKVDRSLLDPSLAPTEVAYSSYRPGTIVVDVDEKRLYHVQEGGRAKRYGIAVGRQGYSLRGQGTIGRKAMWPSWTPTANMVRQRPSMQRHAGPGLSNPLGARALYLYQGNRDTMFRIHGTNEPWSIGTSVSSGCIRLLNEDVLELYDNVSVGATVIVRRNGPTPRSV